MPWFVKLISFSRAVLFAPFLLLWSLVWGGVGLMGVLVTRRPEFQNFVMYTWSKGVMSFLGIRLQVQGQNNLPPSGCIIMFNHVTYFDATAGMMAFYKMKKLMRFGAKAELFKIPVFGWCLRAFGILPIHRGDRDRVLKLYKQSVPRIQKGESFMLAGEGGRHSNPAHVGDKFKTGPVRFAIQAGCPVVPCVILGGHRVHMQKDFWPHTRHLRSSMQVHILPSVPTTEKTLEQSFDLAQDVRKKMLEYIKKSSSGC